MSQQRVYPKAILGPLKDMIIEDLEKVLGVISAKYGVTIKADGFFPKVGKAQGTFYESHLALRVIGADDQTDTDIASLRELDEDIPGDFLQAKMKEYDLLPRAIFGSGHIYEIVGYLQGTGTVQPWQVKRVDIEGRTTYPYSHDLTLEYFGRGRATAMEK